MKVLKHLSTRIYKCGYEVRNELRESPCNGDAPYEMKSAYTPDGHYIGNPKEAHRLVAVRGIQPQLRTTESNVCSVGYSWIDGKWYGWSHRAIFGFKIGSTCKQGDCHHLASNARDEMKDCKRFWSDPDKLNLKARFETQGGVKGVYVYWTYSDKIPNEAMHGKISGIFSGFPDEWGRGEWVAETTADAKQMAMDFASGVG